MKMLKILCCCLLTIMISNVYSQDNTDTEKINRELGLRFSGFNDFNIFYKKALGENTYRRHRIVLAAISISSQETASRLSGNLGFVFGKEKRKPINESFYMIHGWELGLSLSHSNSNSDFPGGDNRTSSVFPSVGYVFGFMLDLSDRFYISAEVIPSIQGNFSFSNNAANVTSINASLSSSSTAVSLMYKF